MTTTEATGIVAELTELGYAAEAQIQVCGSVEADDSAVTRVWFTAQVEHDPAADYDQQLWTAFVDYRKLLARDGFRLTGPHFLPDGFTATVEPLPIEPYAP